MQKSPYEPRRLPINRHSVMKLRSANSNPYDASGAKRTSVERTLKTCSTDVEHTLNARSISEFSFDIRFTSRNTESGERDKGRMAVQ